MPKSNASTIVVSDSNYDFSAMRKRMQWYVDQNILSCCATLVMKGQDVVEYSTFGYQDIESGQPLRADAIYRMYSSTKLITSVALMMLYDQGKFALDDPIAKFLPGFTDMQVLKPDATSATELEPAKSPITMAQVLSHSAGFSYAFIEPDTIIDKLYTEAGLNPMAGGKYTTLEELCDRLAGQPLAYQPGTSWRYSVATDVCARLVEVLSGQTFDAWLQQHLFAPLAMVDTDFWVPPEKADRFTSIYLPSDELDPMKPGLTKAGGYADGTYSQKPTFLSGGGGLCSTVADYLTFLRMLVNDGEWNGTRLLRSATVKQMRTNQLAAGVGVRFPGWSMGDTVFGLGFALKNSPFKGEPDSARDEYQWGGMAGTHSWMAPRANLTGMCLTQRMPGYWHPFSHEFRSMAYQIAG